MSKKRKDGGKDKAPRIVNRRARHDYHVEESLECGIMLRGSEVKAIRNGSVSLGEGFARVEPATMELWLFNIDIAPYTQAGADAHETKSKRKLLAHKREIRKLLGRTTDAGVTLIPLTMYFKDGRVKVEIGVCRGKKQYDKRQSIKERDTQRDMRRAMTRKVI